ncbi:hypothetical protein DM02DRAFT_728003 [Periconia macrospinosa]|uniref:Acyl-CoA dehydrogenase/oxidase C-terminal n=1 Tax=Periconia macrospinosa TaxID=97972 RepID=A0A2V1DSX5_9PLEO|nr:hypothetical protein DM02DRAFT_728003 [Periconia macrospinosa]
MNVVLYHANMVMQHSSSTQGFFQELPDIHPLYTYSKEIRTYTSEDPVLSRILNIYLRQDEELPRETIHNLSRLALSPEVLAHAVDAEVNHPVLKAFGTFGQENKTDPLQTTHGWKELKKIGQKAGVISVSYETNDAPTYNRRIQQFGLGHVWVCTATMTGCPMAMTDGAAKLLAMHLEDDEGDQPGIRRVISETFRRLVSRNPSEAWTSGQWMTERTGGSDVSGTETIAQRMSKEELAIDSRAGRDLDAHGYPLGPWKINGFKWFSSATDSDVSLMLARTENGLGLFLAPMRRASGGKTISNHASDPTELNGIRIQRLKDKIGTKSLPTAELELKNVRAWLIGQDGQGVKEISTILNLTRLHTAATGVGSWARGLQICRAYSRKRRVRGGLLQDNPQHLRWMAENVIKYTAAAHFTFLAVAMLGALEQDWGVVTSSTLSSKLIPSDDTKTANLFRLLTPVLKAQVSVASVHALREHMECLGGVGYCENNEDGGIFNISKIFRDTLVTPIWEGTVSIMAEDVVRVMCDDRIGGGSVLHNIFTPWVRTVQSNYRSIFAAESTTVESLLEELLAMEDRYEKQQLFYRGRDLLWYLESITCSVLLLFDASVDHDEVAIAIARKWLASKISTRQQDREANWRNDSLLNLRIFLGQSVASSVRGVSSL